MRKLIGISFFALFFFTPLLFFPKTVEIFEFNKMVFVYFMTTLITSLWVARMIQERKVIFRHSVFDFPLLIFLLSQLISTYFSIDTRSSLLGIYGRFNGGFLSSISYALLFWAFVSNLKKDESVKAVKMLIASGVFVSVIGFFEHFGVSLSCLVVANVGESFLSHPITAIIAFQQSFDPACWAQDFQTRVFSTLGQPNWLASFLVFLIPISVSFALSSRKRNRIIYSFVTLIFSLVLFFTKSRSGILGLVVSILVFGILQFRPPGSEKLKANKKNVIVVAFITFIIFVLLAGQLSSKIKNFVNPPIEPSTNSTIIITDSLTIRKHVWKAAIEIWKSHPLIGSGVETFDLTFPRYKPQSINLTSEWDFIFNKAHNEYLNFAANSGLFGFFSYFGLLIFTTYLIFQKLKNPETKKSEKMYLSGIYGGYVGLAFTNFFGFSVVATSLIFFLTPAFVFALDPLPKTKFVKPLNTIQKGAIVLTVFLAGNLLFLIGKYWYSDYLSSKASNLASSGNLEDARIVYTEAISLNKYEPYYWIEMASLTSSLALDYNEAHDTNLATMLETSALKETNAALRLAPANLNLKSRAASIYVKLAGINPTYLEDARDILRISTELAPNDVELLYNYGLTLVRTGEEYAAISVFEKARDKKPNYKEPRLALAILYAQNKDYEMALDEANYILEFIEPSDLQVLQKRDEILKVMK